MKGRDPTVKKDNSATDLLFLDRYPAKSRFAEAYRNLRTSIQFSFLDSTYQSLLVTSAEPQEGKTTTVANLCYTMAKAGKKVLMIDADLRKPRLSHLETEPNREGLTGLLAAKFNLLSNSGSLEEMSFSDLLWLIRFQRKSCIAHLKNQDHAIDVYFKKGRLTDIIWLNRPAEKKLAHQLIADNLLDAEKARQVMRRERNTGQKLGFILIKLGLIKEAQMENYLTIHMMESLRIALGLKSGTYNLEPIADSYYERPAYYPADLLQLYKQMIVGEEDLPYLQKEIYSVIQSTEVDNLNLIPAGPLPPNPSELLGSRRLSFLLSFLKRRFDRIIIDSAPVIPASDALILAPQTDGVVFVVKGGKVKREFAAKAVDQIKMTKANVLGVVLNHIDFRQDGYYKNYSSYYGDGN